MKHELKYFFEDNGFCRIVYRHKHEKGHYNYYCFQEDFENVILIYDCTNDDGYYEPNTLLNPKKFFNFFQVDKPKKESKLSELVEQFILENQNE